MIPVIVGDKYEVEALKFAGVNRELRIAGHERG